MLGNDLCGRLRVGDRVAPALERCLHKALHLLAVRVEIIFTCQDAVRIKLEAVIGEQKGLRVAGGSLLDPGFRHDEGLDGGNFFAHEHTHARRRIDVGELDGGRIQAFLDHESLDHLLGKTAGAARDFQPLELLRAGHVGAGAQGKDGVRCFLINDRNHLCAGGAVGARSN